MAIPVQVSDLHKQYGQVTALEDVSFRVADGEVFGFLGPNGAGKTTTINILLAFSSPTTGDVALFGMDPSKNKVSISKRTGTLLEGYGVYQSLTGREHFQHTREVKGVDTNIEALLEKIGLSEAADRPAGSYSKGMKQRMAFGMAIMGQPDLLILDEPTTGMDPNGALMVRDVVLELAESGTTVFFSSHILEQVEAVADRVGIINDGKIIAEGELETLRKKHGLGDILQVDVSDIPNGLIKELENIDGVQSIATDGGSLNILAETGVSKLRCLEAVYKADVFVDFRTKDSSLGDLFTKIMGEAQ
jgi:ABC-2 type transport system ATP-binding protein